MSRLNNEVLENMVMECEDFIRLATDRIDELTNEDLQWMLYELSMGIKKANKELNN